jgi:hypothetical protein
MNPTIGRTGSTQAISGTQPQNEQHRRGAGKSAFEQVRARLKTEKVAAPTEAVAAELGGIPAAERRKLASDLQDKIRRAGTRDVEKVFRPDMERAGQRIQELKTRIEALPKTSALEPLRTRFNNVERLFQRSTSYLNGLGGADSPADMMRIQMHMYQISGNIELMAKVVEQVNTGVKSILQTQV